MKGISSIKVYMLRAPYIVCAFSLSRVIPLAIMKSSKNENAPWLTDFPDQREMHTKCTGELVKEKNKLP